MSTTATTTAATVIQLTYRHECDHGFCTVCGTVWPCWRAERAVPAPQLPTPRTSTIAA